MAKGSINVRLGPPTGGVSLSAAKMAATGLWKVPGVGSGTYWAKKTPDNDVGTAIYGLPSQIMPADNFWNVDISSAPVSTSPVSTDFINAWPGTPTADGWYRLFTGGTADPLGMPIITIGGGTPQVSSGDVNWIDFSVIGYDTESDWVGNDSAWYQGKTPIPVAALTNTGWTEEVGLALEDVPVGDRHMIVFDVDTKYLYEMYQPFYNNTGSPVTVAGQSVPAYSYRCAAVAVWDTTTNNFRTHGWTSGDAAGMQLLPGTVRYDEVTGANPITHAHRCCIAQGMNSVPASRYPATHYAGRFSDSYPPTGTRLRLKAATDISSYSSEVQRLLQAFKTYGVIVVDYGTTTGRWEVTGTPDSRWGDYDQGLCGELRTCGFNMLKTDWEMIEWGWGAPEGWTDVTI